MHALRCKWRRAQDLMPATRRQFERQLGRCHGVGQDVLHVVWSFLGVEPCTDAIPGTARRLFVVATPTVGMMPRPTVSVFVVPRVQDARSVRDPPSCPVAGFFVDDFPRDGVQLWVNLWGRCAAPPDTILVACAQAAHMLQLTTGAAVTSLIVRNLHAAPGPRPAACANDAQAAFRHLVALVAPTLQCLSMECLAAVFGVPPRNLLRDCCPAVPALNSLTVAEVLHGDAAAAAVLRSFGPVVDVRAMPENRSCGALPHP
jgi:hypothetical protein